MMPGVRSGHDLSRARDLPGAHLQVYLAKARSFDTPLQARAALNSLVQCGQRVALIGIDMVQAGQSFATAGASGLGFFIRLKARTIKKIANATMRKLMMSEIKFP